jgi:hypothetical protein
MAGGPKLFGNLGHLVALQTISLSFYEALDTDDLMPGEAWATPDAVLAQARDTLEAVQMYTCTNVCDRLI